jgi:hypothetical protein
LVARRSTTAGDRSHSCTCGGRRLRNGRDLWQPLGWARDHPRAAAAATSVGAVDVVAE